VRFQVAAVGVFVGQFAEDRQDRLPRFRRELFIFRFRVLTGQDFPKSLVNVRLDRVGQLVERLGVDEIAARIFEQPRLQIEIAERTQLPKPTVTRLTYTLTKLGYLTYLERFGRYKLAPAALSIGYAAMANFRIREVARPFMQSMAEEASASVALGGPDRLSMVYIGHCRSADNQVGVQLDVGSRVPMATSAMGRAYLSALTEGEREEVFERMRRKAGADWGKVRGAIEESIDHVARYGFAISEIQLAYSGVPWYFGFRNTLLIRKV